MAGIGLNKTEMSRLRKKWNLMSEEKKDATIQMIVGKITKSDKFKNFIKAMINTSIDHGDMMKRSEILKMDRIDYYISLSKDQYNVESDLPRMSGKVDLCEVGFKNFYLALPPFKKGCLRINKHRYIEWIVTEMDYVEKKIAVSLYDYTYDMDVWYMQNVVKSEYIWESDHISVGSQSCDFLDIITYIDDNYRDDVKAHLDPGVDYDSTLDVVKGIIENGRDELEDKKLSSYFLLAMIDVNNILQQNKPKTLRKSKTKIKTMAGDLDKAPKPKYTRVLSNGISIISEKTPRVYNDETIRKYKIESWHTRGHVRHYKDGKVVYVRESVHHRKCLQDKGEVAPAQQIIQVV